MTTFTRTWNAAYEAQPADTEVVSQGALRIRNLKEDIQERLEVDHSHAGDAEDGKHKKVTLKQIATPTIDTNDVGIYQKSDGILYSKAGAASEQTLSKTLGGIPSGTVMLFYQSAAPVGWTKDTAGTLDDHALRIVTSTAWAAGSNGNVAFSTCFSRTATDGHTLTIAQSGMPAHSHTSGADAGPGGSSGSPGGGFPVATRGTTTGTAAGQNASSAHTHPMDIRVKYINFILCTKD